MVRIGRRTSSSRETPAGRRPAPSRGFVGVATESHTEAVQAGAVFFEQAPDRHLSRFLHSFILSRTPIRSKRPQVDGYGFGALPPGYCEKMQAWEARGLRWKSESDPHVIFRLANLLLQIEWSLANGVWIRGRSIWTVPARVQRRTERGVRRWPEASPGGSESA